MIVDAVEGATARNTSQLKAGDDVLVPLTPSTSDAKRRHDFDTPSTSTQSWFPQLKIAFPEAAKDEDL